MIYNDDFLYKLQNQNIQTKYAKIITLNWQEEPIMEIQGIVTGGSCNIDGNSAIRTTISLNMITNPPRTSQDNNNINIVAETADLTKYAIMLKTKVKIDVGLENNIDKNYPDIIWFPLGIFIVTGYNTSITTSGISITLNGKDKGCLLNGEISGVIGASTDFGQFDFIDPHYEPINDNSSKVGKYIKDDFYDNLYYQDSQGISIQQHYEKVSDITTNKLSIKDIIRSIVHIYGNEPNNKIIINDLDINGQELLEYRGDKPMYLIKYVNTANNLYADLTFDENYSFDSSYKLKSDGTKYAQKLKTIKIKDLKDTEFFNLNSVEDEINKNSQIYVNKNGKDFQIVRIKYGDTIGYKGTELVFPGDLIANVGETVVSVLDKIKNMLGNFEYFYDPFGNFIFQAKHTYESVAFSKIKQSAEEVIIDGSFYNNSFIYTFSDENTTTQISHSPNITNLKNDYSIWGERQSVNNTKVPIHLRYAIQERPKIYTNFKGITFIANDGINEENEEFNQSIEDYKTYQTNIESINKSSQRNCSFLEAITQRYQELIFSEDDEENSWFKDQLKLAEKVKEDDNTINGNYDLALKKIAAQKLKIDNDKSYQKISTGTFTSTDALNTITSSNILKCVSNFKMKVSSDTDKLGKKIKR